LADLLELAPAIRAGEKLSGGAYKSERHFLDFVVNGNSLWERVGKRDDMVTVLCREFASEETRKATRRLLLVEEADFPDDRRSLFICSECGDLGCGAISIAVEKKGDRIMWKNFGYENTYENDVKLSDYADVGPFAFDAAAYQALLSQAIERLYGIRA
jgi:hypothetical protein